MPDSQGSAPELVTDEAVEAAADAIRDADSRAQQVEGGWKYASTTDSAKAALTAAAPLIVAAELERLAEPLRAQMLHQNDRVIRLSKGDAPLWQTESAIASEQELKGFVGLLDRRAAELRKDRPDVDN